MIVVLERDTHCVMERYSHFDNSLFIHMYNQEQIKTLYYHVDYFFKQSHQQFNKWPFPKLAGKMAIT